MADPTPRLNDAAKILNWLKTKPSIQAMRDAFPDEWDEMERELAAAIAGKDVGRLNRLFEQPAALPRGTSPDGKTRLQIARKAVRRRMVKLALAHYSRSILTSRASGKARFNLINGLLAQWLLFKQSFERKPVSMFWFRLIWPLLWQRHLLMPLVETKGIYCFYSKALVSALVQLTGNRRCVEVGAGDGTLTAFLRAQGIAITATDDQSWSHKIHYPEWVLPMDAKTALKTLRPEVVLCSWPPAQNDFEASVFEHPEVELYIAILSPLRFASGSWAAYEGQKNFSMETLPALSELVLPPELGSQVVIFRRKRDLPAHSL